MTTTYPPEPFRIKVIMSLRAKRSNPYHNYEIASRRLATTSLFQEKYNDKLPS